MRLILHSVFIGIGYLLNGFIILYTYFFSNNNYNSCFSMITSSNVLNMDVNTWHTRLGHIKQDRINRLAREGIIVSLVNIQLPICECCLTGKATRKPFGKRTKAKVPLQLVHFDICGLMNVRARSRA